MAKFYVTTPIYYVNDRPHIGHAYTTVMADILARHNRFLGNEVFFLTGTDEHGAKIEEASKKAGMEPQEFCDEKSRAFRDIWGKLGISYDYFIRTTDNSHVKTVQSVLQYLYDKKFIYKGFYEGLYCKGCEQYKTKSELIDGKCPDHNVEPEFMVEESYFFKLSNFQKAILNHIKTDKLLISPESKKKEMLSFLENQPLEDISVSRKNVKWGIPLPFDNTHTCYVWIDAFLNYLTGLDWSGPGEELPENFKTYWPADIQLMAKDILRVHATIWPAMLLALDLPLPQEIFAHGFFTINGQKMSKTLGNVIWPEDLVSKYGADAVRYLLLSFVPFGNDGDISPDLIAEKYNSDLVNGLGNVVSRLIGIVVKNPDANNINIDLSNLLKYPADLSYIYNYPVLLKNSIMAADKRINDGKLWENSEKKTGIISDILSNLLIPEFLSLKSFMPDAAGRILKSFGLPEFIGMNWPEIEKEIQKQPKRKIKITPLEKQLFPRITE